LGSNWKDVQPTDDGPLKKYDLAAGNPILANPALPREPLAAVPDTVWVDPKTGMLAKTITHLSNSVRTWEVTVAYEFGIDGPADIYGAGVPRDARIVDNRPSPETKQILDRVQNRINKGFDNYVGVLTDSLARPEGGVDPIRTTVKLFARKGQLGLAQTYAVLPRRLPNHPGIALPDKWPDVSGEELFALARESTPHSFVAFDKEKVYAGRFLRGRMDPSYAATVDRWTAMNLSNVAQYMWPNFGAFNRYTPQTQFRLVSEDTDHPGLVGIEVNSFGPSNDYYNAQSVFWIDPGQDDLLVEQTETTFRRGSALNREGATDTRVTEVGRLPDGRAYPARWTVTVRRPNPDGFLDPYLTRECRLVMMPDKGFNASWIPGAPAAASAGSAAAPK
jgi:hypothetical protein